MTRRPAVAIVANSLTPYRQHFHRRIARELSDIELWSLFTHDHSSSPWSLTASEEIRPVRFGPGEPYYLQADPAHALHEWRKGGRVIRWLERHEARAVVLMGYNDPCRLRILRWCRRRRIPCFMFGDNNIRGERSKGWRALLKHRLLPRILRQCTGVLACGSLGRACFRSYGVPDDRIFLMPYEPDYERIACVAPEEIRAALERAGLAIDRRRILFAGRLIAQKRADLLLAAFATIAAERPDWDLVLVGDGPLRAELEQLAPERWRARIRWLGFIDDPDSLARLYRGSHVLVLPSDSEPWGVVVNEAAAAGMALIASDVVGAAAELVRDGVNGRSFRAGDAAGLADCLRDVTSAGRLEPYRAASAGVLADWRRLADPVQGLRAALRSAGIPFN